MVQVSRRSAAVATLVGNGATVAITVAQAFLLIPLCLRVLDPTLYSAWLAASELLIWAQLLDGGLPNLLTQRVGALVGREDWAGAARWTSTTFAGLLAIGLGVLALSVALAPLVADALPVAAGDRETFVNCFRVGALSSVLLMLSNGCISLSRGVQRTTLMIGTQVAGAAAGLAITIYMLLTGWGLWALAAGLFLRAGIAAAGGLLFFSRLPAAPVSWWGSPSRPIAADMRRLVPSMSLASVGYVLANNSEVLLVTTVLGPAPALAYALTRRAFDGIRNLLDTIAWAVSGGFANLVAAPDRDRSRVVLAEILWLRFALASLAAGLVVAVNETFVALLFGSANYGGTWLTLTFAAQIMLGGQSFLANYLWRATGHVREGSLLLAAESGARVLAMAAGLLVVGVWGAPIGVALVSLAALIVVNRRLEASLPHGDAAVEHSAGLWVPVGVLAAAGLVALLPLPRSWGSLGLTAASFTLVGALLIWYALPPRLTGELLQRWRSR